MGRPLIMTLWRSGLKCAAMVVRGSHLYACLATSCGSPRALTGGGGLPGVGLFRNRSDVGGRPSRSQSFARPSRTSRARQAHGGCRVVANVAALLTPLTGPGNSSSAVSCRFGGGIAGALGLRCGQTPCHPAMVAEARPSLRFGIRGLSESCNGGEMMI